MLPDTGFSTRYEYSNKKCEEPKMRYGACSIL